MFSRPLLTNSFVSIRIIKKKMGFSLVPAALRGLSQISHLINFEMVEDLVVLLKVLVQAVPPPPMLIRLHAVRCALKTLSGPGEELQADDSVFVGGVEALLLEDQLFQGFQEWDVLLECVELCLLTKRNERHQTGVSMVRSLLLNAMLASSAVSATILGVVHAIMLRYPRLRATLAAFSRTAVVMDNDDQVYDFAMSGLMSADSDQNIVKKVDKEIADSSWGLVLMNRSLDAKVKSIISIVTAANIMPLRYKLSDANAASVESSFFSAMDLSLSLTPRTRQQVEKKGGGNGGVGAGRDPESKKSLKNQKKIDKRNRQNKIK